MSGGGLYLMRLDAPRQVLEICLMDWANVQALTTGPKAADIYDHFTTLGDHAVRDAFAYGVLAGLRLGADDAQMVALAAEAQP